MKFERSGFAASAEIETTGAGISKSIGGIGVVLEEQSLPIL